MQYSSPLKYRTRSDAQGNPLAEEGRRKIFISYKKSDNLFGLRDRIIEMILEALDCAVWYDDSLTPGVDFDREIAQAIRDSDAVVLLLTPHILHSQYVWETELRLALAQKKAILPVSLGIGEQDLAEVNRKLGHLQLLNGDCLLRTEKESSTLRQAFAETLQRALQQFVVRQDLALKVSRFYAAEKDRLPTLFVTPEQLYLKGYGKLKGIGTVPEPKDGAQLLDSLLKLHSTDPETAEFKGSIANDLLLYYAHCGEEAKVLRYAEAAEQYGNADALYSMGSLYAEGNTLPKDEGLALVNYLKAAALDHLPALREAGKLLLKPRITNFPSQKFSHDGSYGDGIPYLKRAAELGGERDLLLLVRAYWNCGYVKEERIKACRALEEAPYPAFREMGQFLRERVGESSYLEVFNAAGQPEVPPENRLGELELGGRRFYLYRQKLHEKQNKMLLMRDGQKIGDFYCSTLGFGDVDFFDLMLNEDGILQVKSAEFDHYGPETLLRDHHFLNPFGEHLLVWTQCDGEWVRGMRKLKYASYGD